MADMNYIELWHKDGGLIAAYIYYLADAKRLAKRLWKSGDYSCISVDNKKDQEVLLLGERP